MGHSNKDGLVERAGKADSVTHMPSTIIGDSMKSNQRPTIVTTMILLTWIAATAATADETDQAVVILDISGIQGGLVVHLGL